MNKQRDDSLPVHSKVIVKLSPYELMSLSISKSISNKEGIITKIIHYQSSTSKSKLYQVTFPHHNYYYFKRNQIRQIP